jgi:hypothetical protein
MLHYVRYDAMHQKQQVYHTIRNYTISLSLRGSTGTQHPIQHTFTLTPYYAYYSIPVMINLDDTLLILFAMMLYVCRACAYNYSTGPAIFILLYS